MRFYPFPTGLSILLMATVVSTAIFSGNTAEIVRAADPATKPTQEPAVAESPALARRRTLAEEIDLILDRAREMTDQVARLNHLATAVSEFRSKAAFNIVAVEQLTQAELAPKQAGSPEPAANRLRDALRSVRDMLKFQPTMEAPLPEGFPEPMPVGEVGVKQYPAYRLARAVDGNEGRAFNQLFQHIQRNNIEMTAPVEMTFEKTTAGEMRSLDMAFLYQSRELGKPGEDKSVKVLDVGPVTTIAIGCRGATDRPRIAEAERRLATWLEANRDKFAAAGPIRMMGYNSPFVPVSLRYFEVEIPVKAVVPKPADGDKPD
jgi:hypothetical protein